MHLLFLSRISLPVVALAVLSVGCAEDTPFEGPASPELDGDWNFGVTIVNETGACAGNNEPPWNADAVITVAGNVVTISSDWNSNPDTGPHEFVGTIDGRHVTVAGSYPEGAGTTTATFDLTVQAGNNRMEGTETWTYDGAIGMCIDSGSLVVVNRINP